MLTTAAVHELPILDVAAALGVEVVNRCARCFNTPGHKSGDVHPSLVLQTKVNRFRCYACGAHGDAIDLVRAVRGIGFREALQWLEQVFPDHRPSPANSSQGTRPPVRSISDLPARLVYVKLCDNCCELGQASAAARYLTGRGIDFEIANQIGAVQIGDPREVWDILSRSFTLEDLRSAGVVSKFGEFHFHRHRLIFLYQVNQELVYIQARDIDGYSDRKELCPVGLCSPVPYNFDLLRQKPEEVYLCEGCIDTLSALQLGYPAIGVPGATGFRRAWFEWFRGVRRVCLMFDNDAAGKTHAAELRSQFRLRGIAAKAVCPRDVKDINDLLVSRAGGSHNAS